MEPTVLERGGWNLQFRKRASNPQFWKDENFEPNVLQRGLELLVLEREVGTHNSGKKGRNPQLWKVGLELTVHERVVGNNSSGKGVGTYSSETGGGGLEHIIQRENFKPAVLER